MVVSYCTLGGPSTVAALPSTQVWLLQFLAIRCPLLSRFPPHKCESVPLPSSPSYPPALDHIAQLIPFLHSSTTTMGRFIDLALLLFGFQAAGVFAQIDPVRPTKTSTCMNSSPANNSIHRRSQKRSKTHQRHLQSLSLLKPASPTLKSSASSWSMASRPSLFFLSPMKSPTQLPSNSSGAVCGLRIPPLLLALFAT